MGAAIIVRTTILGGLNEGPASLWKRLFPHIPWVGKEAVRFRFRLQVRREIVRIKAAIVFKIPDGFWLQHNKW